MEALLFVRSPLFVVAILRSFAVLNQQPVVV
jgi:hypothetical protein